ncbi:MAG: hypothetical protein NT129_01345, partial [Candidatus Aenigmarchaeota archaeon]|nr:hypothetical protein [Candidatus Aenigmarchaeota archaeon]
ERWMNQQEWASIIKKYLKIKEIKKYNTRWYFKWIPTKYCCHFAFICGVDKNEKRLSNNFIRMLSLYKG